jgi:hypothetical protein
MDEEKNSNCDLVAHYEFVVSQWTEYYKLYMQSWSIFGSAILVGLAVALSKFGDGVKSKDIPSEIAAIVPIVILIWFLLTSYFWAMFEMYSLYISDLEGKITEGCKHDVAYRLFSKKGPYWFENKKVGRAIVLALVGLFCSVGYSLIAWKVSQLFGDLFLAVFCGYMCAMVATGAAIVYFVYSKVCATNER